MQGKSPPPPPDDSRSRNATPVGKTPPPLAGALGDAASLRPPERPKPEPPSSVPPRSPRLRNSVRA